METTTTTTHTTQYRTTRPDFTSFTRDGAFDRADYSVTCDPLALHADDAATVVRMPDMKYYVVLGGEWTPAALAALDDPTFRASTVVAILYRTGQSCADAVRANLVRAGE